MQSSDQFGDAGACAFAEVLKSNRSLLDLDLVSFDCTFMLPIQVVKVDALHLQTDNEVGDAGACALGDGLKSNNSLLKLNLVSFRVFYLFVER